MKKMITLLLSLCCVCGITGFAACNGEENINDSLSDSTSVEESTVPHEGLEYALSEDNTHYVVSGIGSVTDTNIVIPSTYNGLPVTSIGYSAFTGCTSLTNVTIPNSVTSIANLAFYDCSGLTNVTIPNSVTSIGSNAFTGCSSLIGVYITDIANWCKINFDYQSNPLFYAKKLYLDGALVRNLVIPDGVTHIGNNSFADCSSLTSVTIPDSVTSIGVCAFYGCDGLTDVTIPDSVTSIGGCAFEKCSALTDVILGNGISSIESWVFVDCINLKNIVVPASVTAIADYAFFHCGNLANLYYEGTADDWENISVGVNSSLKATTRYYYSENQPTTSGNYWRYVDGAPTVWA